MNIEHDAYANIARDLLGEAGREGVLRLDLNRAEGMLYRAIQVGSGQAAELNSSYAAATEELVTDLLPEIRERSITVTSNFMINALTVACRKGAEYKSFISEELEREAS